MSLSKEIFLTVKDYTAILRPNKSLLLYVNDCLDLVFTINQLGVKSANFDSLLQLKEFPLDGLKAQLFIENANQSDPVESTSIVRNKVTFRLTSKHTQYIGKGKMQIRLYDEDGCELKLPEFSFEIKGTINEEFNGNVPEPVVIVTSISASYNQGSTVVYTDTAIEDLKRGLTVTANYSDGTSSQLSSSDYSLSGTLSVGTSTITVTHRNKTTVFQVTVSEKPTEEMYYGRLSLQDVGGTMIQYNQITEAMIKKGVTDGKLTKEAPKTMGKTSMGEAADTAEGDYIVVIVPTAKNYKVTKDNGIGGKVIFDEDTAGANGVDITINNIPCKLYGEILLSQGKYYIYVD